MDSKGVNRGPALVATLLLACSAPSPESAPIAVPQELETSWTQQIQRVIEAAEYRFGPTAEGFVAANREGDMRSFFAPDGVAVQPRVDGEAWRLEMRLQRWGRPGDPRSVAARRPQLGACPDPERIDAHGRCLRRLEYRRAGMTEWYVNGPEGLEFGFDVLERPAGDGWLSFRLGLQGLDASAERASVLLSQGDAPRLRVDRLLAWDADGRGLVARMELVEGDLRIEVDDRGARYPVVVDPHIAPEPEWLMSSGVAGGTMGIALDAGDVNGDGQPDAVVGVPGFDGGQFSEGTAFVFLGNGSSFNTAADWSFETDQPFGFVGMSVAAARVDADAFADVIVGASQYDDGEVNEGAVFVFHGSAGGPSATEDLLLQMDQADAAFGKVVEAVGDLNGDGFGDVAVGVPNWDVAGAGSEEVAVFVYLGSAAGLPSAPDWQALGENVFDRFGTAVSGAGDVNEDGFQDLVVSAPGIDGPSLADVGRVYLYEGSGTGPGTTAAWTVDGAVESGDFGRSVDGAGDVNADGHVGLVVGSPLYSNGQVHEGAVFLYEGDGLTLSTVPDWTVEANQHAAHLGHSVIGAGDLNGDGFGDLAMSAPLSSGSGPWEGAVFVYPGQRVVGPGIVRRELRVDQAYGSFGYHLAAAGDVNADGFDDLLVGGINLGSPAGAGVAFLYLGVDEFTDVDNDGFCAGAGPCLAGIPPGDCNDNDARDFPGAAERCDRIDNDCDGSLPADEVDDDGDGMTECEGDCDDDDDTIAPNQAELCDPIDHDCDGRIDNDVRPPIFWADEDGDGFGDPMAVPVATCLGTPNGMVNNHDDCDDTDETVNPLAFEEICSGVDEDCSVFTPDIPDNDGDAFTPCVDCQGLSSVLQCGDCDDENRAVNPFMAEACGDGIDQNCDGNDPDCPRSECNSPDNICDEPRGCDCHQARGARGSALTSLALVALALLRRRRW
jgi:hypothetical protein